MIVVHVENMYVFCYCNYKISEWRVQIKINTDLYCKFGCAHIIS